jgi:hypothetical protein
MLVGNELVETDPVSLVLQQSIGTKQTIHLWIFLSHKTNQVVSHFDKAMNVSFNQKPGRKLRPCTGCPIPHFRHCYTAAWGFLVVATTKRIHSTYNNHATSIGQPFMAKSLCDHIGLQRLPSRPFFAGTKGQ